ncbi:hypothetical protein F5146DRAFT_1002352 [Armillaria mellea]|nr:hypothetical protein F5146DRAFT_1002352 [Armillaria mellea]
MTAEGLREIWDKSIVDSESLSKGTPLASEIKGGMDYATFPVKKAQAEIYIRGVSSQIGVSSQAAIMGSLFVLNRIENLQLAHAPSVSLMLAASVSRTVQQMGKAKDQYSNIAANTIVVGCEREALCLHALVSGSSMERGPRNVTDEAESLVYLQLCNDYKHFQGYFNGAIDTRYLHLDTPNHPQGSSLTTQSPSYAGLSNPVLDFSFQVKLAESQPCPEISERARVGPHVTLSGVVLLLNAQNDDSAPRF